MEQKIMTVGFVDLSGYGVVSDKIEPKLVFDLLQELYMFAGDIIVKNGGKIRKYMGDAVLFSFDDPVKAVAAAKELALFQRVIEAFTVQT